MTAHVPVALGGSTRGISVRAQRAELRRLTRLAEAGEITQAERSRMGVLRERERLRAFRKGKTARAKRETPRTQMAEMVALEALQRERMLTPQESERLGLLIYREQQRARTRPARIAKLRAELALLETLEMAERGAAAEGCASSEAIDLRRDGGGGWSAPVRLVA